MASEEIRVRVVDVTGPQHPSTGAPLTQRQNTTRLQDGQVTANRRIFFDFTFSPPKSVSIAALVAGDERIRGIHAGATKAALVQFEKFAATRIRRSEDLVHYTAGRGYLRDASGRVTREEDLAREQELIGLARGGAHAWHPLVTGHGPLDPRLDSDQRQCLEQLLGSTHGVTVFHGIDVTPIQDSHETPTP